MKKAVILTVVLLFMGVVAIEANALTKPDVLKDHGVATIMIASEYDLGIRAEYGLTSEWGIIGMVGAHLDAIGAKYEIQNGFAVVAGISSDSPFLGIKGSKKFNTNIVGIYELDLCERDDDLSLLYELGVEIELDKPVDFRIGLVGFTDKGDFPEVELGVGYEF